MVHAAVNRTKVFISYSQSDSKYLKSLLPHLELLERHKQIDLWVDTKINPGERWQDEVKLALASAKVAILLISIDFLNSQFIIENELLQLLTAAKDEGVKIFSIILRPCELPNNLSQFQAINSPSRPLAMMKGYEREQLWVKVANATKEAMSRHLYQANIPKEEATPSKFIPQSSVIPTNCKENHLQEARAHIKAKDWKSALTAYEQVTLLDPYNAIVFYKKGDLLINLKRYDEALVAYRQVVQLDPLNASVYKKIADILKDLKRFDEALIAYEQFIHHTPGDDDPFCSKEVEAYVSMADILFDSMRYEEAIAAYNEVIKLRPDPIYRYEKAYMLYKMKRFDEALAAYDDALTAGVPVPYAYQEKADLLYEMERYEEALTAYDKTIKSVYEYCDLVSIHHTKGKILHKLNRYEEALTAYDNAVSYYKQHHEKVYEQDYTATISSGHNNSIDVLINLYNSRGDVLICLGKAEEAQQSYVQATNFSFNIP